MEDGRRRPRGNPRSSVSGVVRSLQASGANDLPWALLRASPVGDAARVDSTADLCYYKRFGTG